MKKPKGFYLFGGVGCGKTFMMDLFYDSAPTVKKKRMHFSSFMLEIHDRMAKKQKQREEQLNSGFLSRVLPKIHDDIGGTADSSTERSISLFGTKIVLSSGVGEYGAVDMENEDPLPIIAKEIVQSTFLLCLDEFEVTDVADSFILARLFTALFDEGLVLVATSNRAPSKLYEGGLNRQVFLPTIDAINSSCTVISLEDSPTDYRGQKSRSNVEARFVFDSSSLDDLWHKRVEAEEGPIVPPPASKLDSNGDLSLATRSARIPLLSPQSSLCRFTFKELCESASGGTSPMGAAEFAMLASHFSAIFVTGIPNFNNGGATIDGLRRFVLFIDACYDSRCEVYISTEMKSIGDIWDPKMDIVDPRSMNELGDLLGSAIVVPCDTFTKFSLDRTVSRLFEMSSDEYIEESLERTIARHQ